MVRLAVRFSFLYILLTSCSFNPKTVNYGDSSLQGDWEEEKVLHEDKRVSYERYKLRFTCDSFYMDIHNFSKVNHDAGECYKDNNWHEYVKGIYTITGDTLKLKGAFVNEHYRYKPEGSCYRFGNYRENLLLRKKGTDTLVIKNNISPLPHVLVLKNKLECTLIQE